jgi:hypothetical protein
MSTISAFSQIVRVENHYPQKSKMWEMFQYKDLDKDDFKLEYNNKIIEIDSVSYLFAIEYFCDSLHCWHSIESNPNLHLFLQVEVNDFVQTINIEDINSSLKDTVRLRYILKASLFYRNKKISIPPYSLLSHYSCPIAISASSNILWDDSWKRRYRWYNFFDTICSIGIAGGVQYFLANGEPINCPD